MLARGIALALAFASLASAHRVAPAGRVVRARALSQMTTARQPWSLRGWWGPKDDDPRDAPVAEPQLKEQEVDAEEDEPWTAVEWEAFNAVEDSPTVTEAAPPVVLKAPTKGGEVVPATASVPATSSTPSGASDEDTELLALQGELWLLAQGLLMLFIAGGDAPVAGSLFRLDVGVLGMIVGAGAMALGYLDLGPGFTPFTMPSTKEGTSLRTEGIYAICRHPMYAGLLIFCASFSILTDSFTRLALTAALFLVVDKKAALEEAALEDKYGAPYKSYKSITKRFVPVIQSTKK